jgi:uncharacterized Tic20 family protein
MKDIAVLLGALLLRFLFVAPFMLLFWWLRRSARKHKPKEENGVLEFTLAPGMRILISIVVVALLGFSALAWVASLSQGGVWYVVLIPLSVLAAILLAWPRTVVLDHNGIRQRLWLMGDREVGWSDIAWMKRGRRTEATYVKSKQGGRPISFSPLLVSQSLFEKEVRARAGRYCNLDEA